MVIFVQINAMKNIILTSLFLFIYQLGMAQFMASSLETSFSLPEEKKPSNPTFDNKKVVYIFGDRFCYLDYHTSKAIEGDNMCWKGDIDKFYKTISNPAKSFIDSITLKYKFKLENLNCVKLFENNIDKFRNENYVKTHRYAYFTFERTFDCYEKRFSKNYNSKKIKISNNSKVYLECFKSKNGVYEKINFYVID